MSYFFIVLILITLLETMALNRFIVKIQENLAAMALKKREILCVDGHCIHPAIDHSWQRHNPAICLVTGAWDVNIMLLEHEGEYIRC